MGYRLTIEPIGQTIDVEDGQTLLDASLRSGVYLPHACGHGLCGTCKVQVLDGTVDHGQVSNFALMEYEREKGLCLACCATPESDVSIEADIDVEPDAKNIPVRDFSGTVERIETLSPTIKGVHVRLAGGELQFQAGQYINLQVPGEGSARAFSIASSPAQGGHLELNVKHVPGGRATTWIHESLRVGDQVKLSGPYGRFFVRKSAGLPMLFIAGGSGLSSPRSMVLDLLEENSTLPMTLLYGARNRAELYYHDELAALAAAHPNLSYVPVLSDEPAGSGWPGLRGFVHDAAKARFNGDFRGHKAYLCGPPAMIEACIATLMRGRLYERDIYTERFLSAADAQQLRSPLFKNV
jgi:phenol/toluene 2-monooxygenase (NADH) P5/A5